ncbi:MAG: aminopeptidase [SAR324 cluster bacterium]|nr:aminopeptidase [SAR324 cluster bacterium]
MVPIMQSRQGSVLSYDGKESDSAPSLLHGRAGAAMRALLGLLALAALFSGCSDVAYYWQAGVGQWEILSRRRAISDVLEDPQVDEQVKGKLRLVLKVQKFSQERLALPSDSQYRYYSDLGRKFVSWLTVASDAYQIREYQHCFLIVGCLGYKGFFEKEDADAFAADLAAQGYDVMVRPVKAYSTLGWFDDPVLNTFIRGSDLQLIATILHEQAHTLMFLKGDTAFSESFSTFVEEEGVRRYLLRSGESGAPHLAKYLTVNEDRRRFREIVLGGRERLERLYASGKPKAEMTVEKRKLFALLKTNYQKAKKSFKIVSFDGWFNRELNNAHLVGFQHYRSWINAFRALFEGEGQDFNRFYGAVRKLAELSKEEREARLKAMEENSIANS